MKTRLFLVALAAILSSCNNSKKENQQELENTETSSVNEETGTITASKGYKLMQQKCYMCHLEAPDPALMDQMIAPPMLRVQEHYKATYPGKEEFINEMVAFIRNPSEETTLMPGAVNKFNLMPKLIYEDAELRLIAETIYEHEFGTAPKLQMQLLGDQLKLNDGKKWVLKKETMDKMEAVLAKLNNDKPGSIEDYNQLGKEIFNNAKVIMLDDSYKGELFDQIHIFFSGIENNMHSLMSTSSMEEAEKQVQELKTRFTEFEKYFRAGQ